MNDSADIPSIRGVLHQHQHRGPVETATAPSYYDGKLRPALIPRGIGDQLQPARVDGSQGSTQSGYRGLASGPADGAEQNNTYVPKTRELGQTGIEQPLPGSVLDSCQELPHGGSAYASDYMRQGQYAGDRQQIKSEQSVSDMQINWSSKSPPNSSQTISGQKRNAVGEIKSPSADIASPGHGVDGSAGYRSRSISSASHESRIAALSMQLRTRLSHAAAKVEKNRQSQDLRSKSPLHALRGATPALSSASPVDNGKQLNVGIGLDDRPDDTAASALNRSATYSFHPSNGSSRFPETLPSYSNSQSTQPTSQYSSRKSQQVPKLAPPVDIISGGSSRRRPNPNEWAQPPQINPPSRHRRHHSQLECGASEPYFRHDTHTIPGTPSLRPSYEYPTSTPYNGCTRPPTDSQESSMEQDAIETLLFMSSPENSGYRSNARRRNNTISNSIDSSMASGSSSTSKLNPYLNRHMNTHYNTGPPVLDSHDQSRHNGLEAQAGDEIDRMLDQMGDSDSEDEKRFASAHSRSHTVANHSRRCNGLSGS